MTTACTHKASNKKPPTMNPHADRIHWSQARACAQNRAVKGLKTGATCMWCQGLFLSVVTRS